MLFFIIVIVHLIFHYEIPLHTTNERDHSEPITLPLTQYDHLQIHPSYCKLHDFIFSCNHIVFHYVYVPHVLYSVILMDICFFSIVWLLSKSLKLFSFNKHMSADLFSALGHGGYSPYVELLVHMKA